MLSYPQMKGGGAEEKKKSYRGRSECEIQTQETQQNTQKEKKETERFITSIDSNFICS